MTSNEIHPSVSLGAMAQGHNGGQSAQANPESIKPVEIAVGVVIGRASEYFDFFVFGIASALVFPSVFFPFAPRLEATLWAFAVFALAFIARPFGSMLFMGIQRRWGRAVKLTGALFLLGICTAGVAFLPPYSHLGSSAIFFLGLLRVGQGVAVGGSWDGLPSLLALHTPPEKRGWYAMIGQLGAPLGFVLACGMFSFMLNNIDTKDFLDWGWRYPFYVAFAINVVALFARLQLVTNTLFSRLLDEKELEPSKVSDLTRDQSVNIFIGAFAAIASLALFHIVTVFPLSWVSLFSNRPIEDFLHIQLWGALLAAGGIVASGWMADRIGRRSALGMMAIPVAAFSLAVPSLLSGPKIGQDLFILIGFLVLGLSYGQAAGAVTSNFEPKYRYTGAALTSDFAWLLGAAFAPLVALGLSARFGLVSVSIYLLSGVACTLLALYINKARTERS
ncbi:MAG: MFS transporter [Burkholderiales bacterium]|nr:MFS transporter [Burkholderiales bacterium]